MKRKTNLLVVMSASPILAEFSDAGKWLSQLGTESIYNSIVG